MHYFERIQEYLKDRSKYRILLIFNISSTKEDYYRDNSSIIDNF